MILESNTLMKKTVFSARTTIMAIIRAVFFK